MDHRIARAVSLLLCNAVIATASPAQAATPVRVVDLAPAEARSADRFGNIFSVRPMADGKVLVDDGVRRQLVLLDANLTGRTVILDSVSVNGNGYGRNPSPLIPYLGDSSLFVDLGSRSLLVISPAAKIARIMAVPNANDLGLMANAASATDARGNLVYRGRTQVIRDTLPSGGLGPMRSSDFAPVLRADFDSRMIDTIGQIKVVPTRVDGFTADANGTMRRTTVINPLVSIDGWSVLSDGTFAIVRGGDYHVDFVARDGRKFTTPKLPFDWKRVTDSAKLALLDSARAAVQLDYENEGNAAAARAASAGGGGAGISLRSPVSAGTVGGVEIMRPAAGSSPGVRTPLVIQNAPLSAIADYFPSIRTGATKADLDGNLWILPTTSAQSKNGELVYDVVNNRGELTHRVRVPLGRSIAGFGRGGMVYLMHKDGESGWVLERSRVPK